MERGVYSSDVPRWSIIEALLVLGVIWGSGWLLPLSNFQWFINLGRVMTPDNVYLGLVFWDSFIRGVCFFLFIGLIIKFKYHLSWAEIGLRKGVQKNWWFRGIGQGFLLFFVMTIISAIIGYFFQYDVPPQQVTEVLFTAKSWWAKVLCVLLVSLVAPLSEELYFRGFLYPAVDKIIGRLPALVLTSSFFAFLHFDVIRFIPITIVGIWLNLLYIKTGSLYTSMIAHSTWNTLMILLLFWAQSVGAI